MDEENAWFLKHLALDLLLRLTEIEKLAPENSIRNSKTVDFVMTKKDAKRFVDIISGI